MIGVARRQETLNAALRLGYIDAGYTRLEDGASQADIVILAAPVRVIIDQIHLLGAFIKPDCLVMDLGSTKQEICQALDSLPANTRAIGGHPMCGKEISGIEQAEPGLYRDKVFALVPTQRTDTGTLQLAVELVRTIGARPLMLQAAQHDRLAAAISHLPYLAAASLVRAAEQVSITEPLVWDLAASGFRDSTRLAASDLTMMLDIVLTNRDAILDSLERFTRELELLRQAVTNRDVDALYHLLSAASARRKEMSA